MSGKRKRAVVTGAASGIGKAVARRMIAENIDVVVADINAEAVAHAVGELQSVAAKAIPCILDVSDAKECRRIGADFGVIDILVANAGVQTSGSFLDTDDKAWDSILEVNLKGVANCCRAVLPGMGERGTGAIVVVSSNNAICGSRGMAAYDASKSALLSLVRSIAIEHGKDGVRANSVCPGTTITDHHLKRLGDEGIDVAEIYAMTSGTGLLGRAAEPSEVANAIFFLASDQASYITGTNLMVDGGFFLAGGH